MSAEMPSFGVPQFYETAIAMRDRGEDLDREFRFLCTPVTAIHEENRLLLNDLAALISVLDLTDTTRLRELNVAQLPDAIFTLLRADVREEQSAADATSVVDLVSSPSWLAGQREADPAGALFAEYLAFADAVSIWQVPHLIYHVWRWCMIAFMVADVVIIISSARGYSWFV
jgi:hypothetical protein